MACYAIGSQMTLRCRKIFCYHSGTLRQLYAPTFVPPFTQKIGSYRGLIASLFKLHGSQRMCTVICGVGNIDGNIFRSAAGLGMGWFERDVALVLLVI